MTDYKEAVERLKAAAIELQQVTVTCPEGSCQVDLSGAFLYAIGFVQGIADGLLLAAPTTEEVEIVGDATERIVYVVIAEGARALKNNEVLKGYA